MVDVVVHVRSTYDCEICIITLRNTTRNDCHLKSTGSDELCHRTLLTENSVRVNRHVVTTVCRFLKFLTKFFHGTILGMILVLVECHTDFGGLLLRTSTACSQHSHHACKPNSHPYFLKHLHKPSSFSLCALGISLCLFLRKIGRKARCTRDSESTSLCFSEDPPPRMQNIK